MADETTNEETTEEPTGIIYTTVEQGEYMFRRIGVENPRNLPGTPPDIKEVVWPDEN